VPFFGGDRGGSLIADLFSTILPALIGPILEDEDLF